jgi:hypothetical protein
MESIPILVPAFGLVCLIQAVCIACIHRRVRRLEDMPPPQPVAWIPEPTYFGVPIQSPHPQWQAPPPSAPYYGSGQLPGIL